MQRNLFREKAMWGPWRWNNLFLIEDVRHSSAKLFTSNTVLATTLKSMDIPTPEAEA